MNLSAKDQIESEVCTMIASIMLEAADHETYKNLTGPEALRLIAKRVLQR